MSEGPRSVWHAMAHGLRSRCPNCGDGPLFDGFVAVHDRCGVCGEALHHHRADDASAYFNILIVGHVVVALVLWVEVVYAPALWVHFALWTVVATSMTVLLMRPVKGAIIGLQWATFMHGFDPAGDRDDPRFE